MKWLKVNVSSEYQSIDIEKIKENTWNPNSMNDKDFKALVKSIEKVWDNSEQPIMLRPAGNGTYEIIDGAHRYRACLTLGYKTVIAIVKQETDAQARLDTIAMNKLRWDFNTTELAQLLADLKEQHWATDEELEEVLWYTSDELKTFDSFVNFDFSDFDEEIPDELLKSSLNAAGLKEQTTLLMTPKQAKALEDLKSILWLRTISECLLFLVSFYKEKVDLKMVNQADLRQAAEDLL